MHSLLQITNQDQALPNGFKVLLWALVISVILAHIIVAIHVFWKELDKGLYDSALGLIFPFVFIYVMTFIVLSFIYIVFFRNWTSKKESDNNKKVPTSIKRTCPHCKETDRDFWWENRQEKEGHYCHFCGHVSLYKKGISKYGFILKKPNEKELDYFLSEEHNGLFTSTDHTGWVSPVEKKDIKFEVLILKDGEYNSYPRNFREAENQLKVLFHQTGITPCIGDTIESTQNNKPGEPEWIANENFVIVGRYLNLFMDCEIIHLHVVEEERWLKKQGW